MRRNHQTTVMLVGIAVIASAMVGCATGGKEAADWQAKATFGQAEDLPRVAVYGNLARFVPRFDPTPKLDEFLYGPSEPPGLLLRNAQGLAILDGKLLVCDQGYPDIIGIDLATGRSNTWQDNDHCPRCPVAIIVGDDGRVYVADTTLRAVLVYAATGVFVEQITPSQQPDRKFRPCSLAMRGGILHIGNLGDRRVDRWESARRAWIDPMPTTPDAPLLIAPTGLAFTGDGTLLIVDSVQARVFRVTANGQWLKPIGSPGRQPGQFVRPKQIVCTPSGLICVTDAGRQSVTIFDVNGEYITELHEQNNAWRGFTLPAGVLSLPSDVLSMLMPVGKLSPQPRPDEWLIVSDTLDSVSLNLFGIMLPRGEGATHAAP